MSRGLAEKLDWTEPDPERESVEHLFANLADADGPADDGLEWPETLWHLLATAGATRWSLEARIWRAELPPASLGAAVRTTCRGELDGGFHPFSARCGCSPFAGGTRFEVAQALATRHRTGTSIHNGGNLASDDFAPVGGTTGQGRRARAGVISS